MDVASVSILIPSVCWTDEFGLDEESPFGAEEFEVPPPPFVRDGEEEDEVVARIVQN
jgi:hypothetical protein